MKLNIFIYLLFLSIASFAQKENISTPTDTLAPYQKTVYIPSFNILTPDSAWFTKSQLQKNRPTLILYFSPDCGHCQLETEEIISKMKDFKNLQIVMITSRPFADMRTFADRYKLHRLNSLIIGTDPSRMVTRFYDVKFTPFSALYDKSGKFVKVYKDGIDMEDLITLVN